MNTETKICLDEWDDYCEHGNPCDGEICEKCADAAITPTERAVERAEAKVQAATEWMESRKPHAITCPAIVIVRFPLGAMSVTEAPDRCTCGKEAILDKLRRND